MLEPTVRGPSPTDSLQAAGSAPTVEEPQQSSCCNCPKRMKCASRFAEPAQQQVPTVRPIYVTQAVQQRIAPGAAVPRVPELPGWLLRARTRLRDYGSGTRCPVSKSPCARLAESAGLLGQVQPANAAPAPSFPSTPIPLVLQPRRLFSEQPGSSSDDFADGPSWPEEVPLEPFPEDELSADLSDELRRDGLSGEELFVAERTPFASPSASPSRRSPSPHLGSALAAARMRALEAMREGSETPTSDVATPNRSLPPLPPTPGAPGSGMRRTMTHVASPSDSTNPAENFMMVELSQSARRGAAQSRGRAASGHTERDVGGARVGGEAWVQRVRRHGCILCARRPTASLHGLWLIAC